MGVRVGGPTEDRHVLEQKRGKRQRYRETFGFTKIVFGFFLKPTSNISSL